MPHRQRRFGLPPDTRVNLDFAISSWAACGPGLATPAQWEAWAAQPHVPDAGAPPDLPQVPSLTRRRLNALGRTTLQAAYDAQSDHAGIPVVLGSRYGDASRSLDLLADLVRGDPVSPTGFGLSVHNAIGALYAIVRGDRAPQLAIAAGAATACAVLVEAASLLADGAPEVLVVVCDAPLPSAYAEFEDGPSALYAWAWRVTSPVAGRTRFSVSTRPADGASAAAPDLPFGLDVLRFVLSGDARWQRAADGTCWTWERHDG